MNTEAPAFAGLRITERLLDYNQRIVQGIGIKWGLLDQLHSNSFALE